MSSLTMTSFAYKIYDAPMVFENFALNLSSEEWYRYDADLTSIGETFFFLMIRKSISILFRRSPGSTRE